MLEYPLPRTGMSKILWVTIPFRLQTLPKHCRRSFVPKCRVSKVLKRNYITVVGSQEHKNMKKLILIPPLLILGCLIAGLYGMLHNQISYSVSHDYFDQFKFIQFRISPAFQGRMGASLVGWAASWWMGIVIGAFLLPIATVVPGDKRYFMAVIRAYGVVASTALMTGLLALLYTCATLDATTVGEVMRYGQKIDDPVAFMRAITMHNFSYLGGLLGIITGSVWLILERRRAISTGQQGNAPDALEKIGTDFE